MALDRDLEPAVLTGEFRLVVITGNAGDGKTAFLQRLEKRAEEQAVDDSLADERLRLIFTCCHPALRVEHQIALTLRLLGGLEVDEIARMVGRAASEEVVETDLVQGRRRCECRQVAADAVGAVQVISGEREPKSKHPRVEFEVRDVVAGYDIGARDLVSEYERFSFEQVHAPVLDLLPDSAGCVLDVGAGSGILSIVAAKLGAEVLAVEDDVEAVKLEQVNSGNALWARSTSEVTDEEYDEFYKHVAHDFEAPLVRAHNRVEGNVEYTSLLYVPARAPFDMWDRNVRRGVHLYVRRVFIMDDAEQLMPTYLRFVRGVVDSNDLSLNVSRELLQQDETVLYPLLDEALELAGGRRRQPGPHHGLGFPAR